MGDYTENTVVDTNVDITPDDAGQGQQTQQDDVQGQISDKLREFIGEVEGDQEKANPNQVKTEDAPQKEPGWLKMRLMDENRKGDKAGYERAQQEINSYKNQLAEMQAKLDKYADMELDIEAKELAVKENVSVELAKRLIRAERGQKPVQNAPEAAKEPQARDEKGRFTANEHRQNVPNEEQIKAQAQAMYDEGMRVHEQTGIDVIDLYLNNPEVKKRVNSREWDLKDVAIEYMKEVGFNPGKKTPSPIRSGGMNDYGAMNVDFLNMTQKQYDAFNKRLDEGYEYRP